MDLVDQLNQVGGLRQLGCLGIALPQYRFCGGLTISSSWGNGHATLWRGLCRALAQRSHAVVFFERDTDY